MIYDTAYLLIHKLYFPAKDYHGTEEIIDNEKKY